MTRRSPGSLQIVWGVALSGALVWAVAPAAAATRFGLSGPCQGSASTQTAPPQVTSQPAARQATPPPTTPVQGAPGGRSGAGGPGPLGEWWRDQTFTKDIGLRPNQAADIDRIYNRRLREMDPVLKDYTQERATLDKMIADRAVDYAQVNLQAITVNALWSKLSSSHTLMLYRMSRVLDTDQYARLRARMGGPRPANPGREWWKDDADKKEIGLRPAQATEIDNFYSRRLKDMDPIIQAYNQQRDALEKMIADRVVDDTTVDVQVTRVDALFSQLRTSRTLMLYRISKVLDADQYAKLQAIEQRQLAERRGRGGHQPAPLPAPRALSR